MFHVQVLRSRGAHMKWDTVMARLGDRASARMVARLIDRGFTARRIQAL